ncbi:hypothetical protein, partial [Escherichia coli]
MFPKIMNDENFFKKAAAHGEEPPLTPQNEHMSLIHIPSPRDRTRSR